MRPSCMRRTRLASSATSGSWVLATTVTLMLEHRSRSSRTTMAPVRWSRLAVGLAARASPIGLLGYERVMGAGDDGDAHAGTQIAEQPDHDGSGALVKVGGGLVGQDQPDRTPRLRAGHGCWRRR